jgi:hypothetical protein
MPRKKKATPPADPQSEKSEKKEKPKNPKGAGRKKRFTPKMQAMFLELLNDCKTVDAACALCGIDTSTYRKERLANPIFAALADKAKDSRVEDIEDSLYLKGMSGDTRAMEVLLYNRAPERWKSITRIQATLDGQVNQLVSGQIDINHRLAGMSDEALQVHIKNLALITAQATTPDEDDIDLVEVLFSGQSERNNPIIDAEFVDTGRLEPNRQPQENEATADVVDFEL